MKESRIMGKMSYTVCNVKDVYFVRCLRTENFYFCVLVSDNHGGETDDLDM